MKKIIALMLSLCMCFSVVTPAMATERLQNADAGILTTEQQQIYESNMRAFQRTNLNLDLLSVAGVDNLGGIVYRYDITENICNYLKIVETETSVVVDVYEGDRHDTIEYLNTGVKVDGILYEYTTQGTETRSARARNLEYLSSPPVGYTTGSYSYSHSTTTDNITLAKRVAEFTTTALCYAIATYAFPELVSTAIGNGVITLISAGISQLINDAIERRLSNKYMSIKINYYEHENSNSLNRVYRIHSYFYNAAAASGSQYKSSTYYYYNYFS